MAVDPVANQIIQQPGLDSTIGNGYVAPQTVDIAPAVLDDTNDADFQGINPLAFQSALAAIGPGYTPVDPGDNLVTFSTLAEARKWLGSDVNTVYFEKSVVNGVTYLKPLQVERPKTFNYSNLAANKLEYYDNGAAPIAFTQSLPTASAFLKLHSMEQIALMQLLGSSTSIAHTSPRTGSMDYISLTFPASGNEPATTAVLSQDHKKVYIVEKLQVSNFSVMGYDDQLAISKTAAFNQIKETLGLTGTTEAAIAEINKIIADIKAAFPDNATTTTVALRSEVTTISQPSGSPEPQWDPSGFNIISRTISGQKGYMTLEHRDLYIKQLELIKSEITEDMAVFNPTSISDKAVAIQERFNRTLAFGDIPVVAKNVSGQWVVDEDPSAAVKYTVDRSNKARSEKGYNDETGGQSTRDWRGISAGYQFMLSSDNNKTVKEGFDLFVAQEKKYFEAAKSRRELIKNISENNISMDAPTMLYQLQIYYNIVSDANIACTSEELRQQNDLLNSYSKAQQLISTTIGYNKETRFLAEAYGNNDPTDPTETVNEQSWTVVYWTHKSEPDGTKRALDVGAGSYVHVMSMFQTNNGKAGATAPKHPIEKLRNITRPYIELTGSSGGDYGTGWPLKKSVAAWQQDGNKLAETVSLIGQETQNSLNKISGFEKDKARYTDMASNTLSKMNEMILAIGRSL